MSPSVLKSPIILDKVWFNPSVARVGFSCWQRVWQSNTKVFLWMCSEFPGLLLMLQLTDTWCQCPEVCQLFLLNKSFSQSVIFTFGTCTASDEWCLMHPPPRWPTARNSVPNKAQQHCWHWPKLPIHPFQVFMPASLDFMAADVKNLACVCCHSDCEIASEPAGLRVSRSALPCAKAEPYQRSRMASCFLACAVFASFLSHCLLLTRRAHCLTSNQPRPYLLILLFVTVFRLQNCSP